MSNDSDVYLRVVLKSIDTINDSLPVALRLPGKPESVLIGDDGIYDSYIFSNLTTWTDCRESYHRIRINLRV